MTAIHPTAIISARAELAPDVRVGPYAIIGDGCVVSEGCVIAARAVLERNVRLGPHVAVGVGSILGGDPQDLKFRGEETTVEIGEGTTIREYATVNRGTTSGTGGVASNAGTPAARGIDASAVASPGSG